jgi:hypothetical protein
MSHIGLEALGYNYSKIKQSLCTQTVIKKNSQSVGFTFDRLAKIAMQITVF